jgi:hypothetical protein
MRKKNLSMSSAAFTPSIFELGSHSNIEEFKSAILNALPAAAIAISKSRKPQQPLVFVTGLTEIAYAAIAELFLEYDPEFDEGKCTKIEDLGSLGGFVHDHINGGWPLNSSGLTDRHGRPFAWDEEFIPSNVVLAFDAASAQNAYIRVVVSIASVADKETCRELSAQMWKEEITEDDSEEFAAYQAWLEANDETDDEYNYMAINTDCEMLFLHFDDESSMSVGIVKMSAVIDDAIEFSI